MGTTVLTGIASSGYRRSCTTVRFSSGQVRSRKAMLDTLGSTFANRLTVSNHFSDPKER